ncbi:MAG TPA: 3-oxoacid CoA-transferase subunit A [Selenomonadales bacterium]|nr:3-oxoacid CoA-transferase subunit A [Selenomonadales bacterium]
MAVICSARQALAGLTGGMSVMVAGFLGVGTPEELVGAVIESGVTGLTVIANDSAFPGVGVGRLQDSKQIGKLHASYIGGHSDTGKCMETGEMDVVLTPQGTLAEQIRAGGSGLGGFLTPTGVGTVVANGKQEMTVNGRTYLLELPLKADFALLRAHRADAAGNLIYRNSARNFNPLMAMAAEVVVAEVDEVVPVGAIAPEEVMTPGIFIDYIVIRGEKNG